MSEILNKTIVLVLNRNWQAIHVRTPQEAFCMMATNVATALEIEFGDSAPASSPCGSTPSADVGRVDHTAGASPGQRRADRARSDPRADGHRGGELCQSAQEAPEAVREDDS